MIEPEDVAWFVRWAELLHKIRAGAGGDEPIELTPGDCVVLVRGVEGLAGLKPPIE